MDVLFVEISPGVISILEQLAVLYPLNVIPNLSWLSKVREPLSKITEYKGSDVLGERQDDAVGQVQGLRIRGPFRLKL